MADEKNQKITYIFVPSFYDRIVPYNWHKNQTMITEHLEMSSNGIFSRLTEGMTSVISFILLDQRSKVDHSKVAVDLEPVLKFVVSRTEHWRFISIL